jgi:hypothetical protein
MQNHCSTTAARSSAGKPTYPLPAITAEARELISTSPIDSMDAARSIFTAAERLQKSGCEITVDAMISLDWAFMNLTGKDLLTDLGKLMDIPFDDDDVTDKRPRPKGSQSSKFEINPDAEARCKLMLVSSCLPQESDNADIEAAAIEANGDSGQADGNVACTCRELRWLSDDLIKNDVMTEDRAARINQAIENLTGVSRPLIEVNTRIGDEQQEGLPGNPKIVRELAQQSEKPTPEQKQQFIEILPDILSDLELRLEPHIPGIRDKSDAWASTELGQIASELAQLADASGSLN